MRVWKIVFLHWNLNMHQVKMATKTTTTITPIINPTDGKEYEEITTYTVTELLGADGELITVTKEHKEIRAITPASSQITLAQELAQASPPPASEPQPALDPPMAAELPQSECKDYEEITTPASAPSEDAPEYDEKTRARLAEKYKVYYSGWFSNNLIYKWNFRLPSAVDVYVIIANAKSLDEAKINAILMCLDKDLPVVGFYSQCKCAEPTVYGSFEYIINNGNYTVEHPDFFKENNIPCASIIMYKNTTLQKYEPL
jgi:hypothetical protein